MKFLIVNADDFGLSPGVNKGIILAHQQGIMTSTSLMVDGPAAIEAPGLATFPNLSIGLHFQLTDESLVGLIRTHAKLYFDLHQNAEQEFNRQLQKFEALIGRLPDHLDSHHHIHKYPQIRLILEKFAHTYNIPVRDVTAPCVRSFFGRDKFWHERAQRISVGDLKSILTRLPTGSSELMCHPAIMDMQLAKTSRYVTERQLELQTLTNESVKEFIQEQNIKLINWRQLD